jgi:hypothetical protein
MHRFAPKLLKTKWLYVKVLSHKELVVWRRRVSLAEGVSCALKVKEDAAGALVRDAVGGDGVQDFGERRLNVGEGLHAGESGAEDVGATDDAGGEFAALATAVVVEAESLAAKGGRAARDAICFEMIASAEGHECLLKKQLAASN